MNSWDNWEKMYGNPPILQGKDFVTTIFNPLIEEQMILITGDNIDGTDEGLTFLFIYLIIDGEVDHGLETLAFNNPEEAQSFVQNLPKMTALQFMFKTLGVQPGFLY
ncbi:hypothetical protein CSV69_14700 [Sporosarcina sp. P26b]|uniref:hypothetical protein n=1 Tax=Sporosarcina sp. P26b TaxID=2048253 RepID=UPI000C170019|nr:hypothetical protein [Sporosarcina sp. P26b]PIC94834.1 hypothetical protein CSV69_14700 [Sporosarcina sp. P26b]